MPQPQDRQNLDRALHIVAQHLAHAQRSHQQALRLQSRGLSDAAREQSRMTRVFLHNALHRIDDHAGEEGQWP